MSLYINLIISVVYFEQSPFFSLTKPETTLYFEGTKLFVLCHIRVSFAELQAQYIHIYILYKNSKTLATLIFSFGTFNDSWLVWTEIDQKYSQCSSTQMAHKPV